MTIACYERLSVAFPLFVKLIYLRNIYSSIFVHTSIYILNNVLIFVISNFCSMYSFSISLNVRITSFFNS